MVKGFFAWLFLLGIVTPITSAEVLSEFAYQQATITVSDINGKPIVGASVYGFAKDLNLLWPRIDRYDESDILWKETFVGKSGADGSVKAVLPPGKWGFFSVGTPSTGTLCATWSDFATRSPGEIISLKPVAMKERVLCSFDGDTLLAQKIFVRPKDYPIWLPALVSSGAATVRMEMSSGNYELWATGEANGSLPAFALSWGWMSDQTAEGRIKAAGKHAVVESTGGDAALSWLHPAGVGLEGHLPIANGGKVLLNAGDFLLSWKRPVAGKYIGDFASQLYRLKGSSTLALDFNSRFMAGLDQRFSEPDKNKRIKLHAQLYLVDTNGHVLSELLTLAGQRVRFNAIVVYDGMRAMGKQAAVGLGEQTAFHVDVGTSVPKKRPTWEFAAIPGVIPKLTLSDLPEERVKTKSATFSIEGPRVLEGAGNSFLSQIEGLAAAMEGASGRKRRRQPTEFRIEPGRTGASAAHSGQYMRFGPGLWYFPRPALRHSTVHELGHNYNFSHGGLHETMVEIVRAGQGAQIGQQDVKWLFFDRMNGTRQKEKVGYEKPYPNIGLYLYCYAKGGTTFTGYMVPNEEATRKKLIGLGYTEAEIITALCSVGMGREMTAICRAYGLAAAPERIASAVQLVPKRKYKK